MVVLQSFLHRFFKMQYNGQHRPVALALIFFGCFVFVRLESFGFRDLPVKEVIKVFGELAMRFKVSSVLRYLVVFAQRRRVQFVQVRQEYFGNCTAVVFQTFVW